jgi:hypothetical protein
MTLLFVPAACSISNTAGKQRGFLAGTGTVLVLFSVAANTERVVEPRWNFEDLGSENLKG